MSRYSRILWIHGLYASRIARGYGGGERSFHLASLIAEITGGRLIHVAIREPRGMHRTGLDNIILVELSRASLLARMLLKPFASILGSRSSARALGLRALKLRGRDRHKLLKLVDTGTLVVLDSLRGYLAARGVVQAIRRKAGLTVYLGHNFEADYYSSLRSMVMRLEGEAIRSSDLVIAASLRDMLRYTRDLGAPEEKTMVFPNIFPPRGEYLQRKNSSKTMAIITGPEYCGEILRISRMLGENKELEVLVFGGRCRKIDGVAPNVKTIGFIESRREFLSKLSKAHIGLNYGLWLGGSSTKRYDYALAGLAVASNSIGARGYPLPGEICFADEYDLAAKVEAIPVGEAVEMGEANHRRVLEIYEEAVNRLRRMLA